VRPSPRLFDAMGGKFGGGHDGSPASDDESQTG
jgi:hypothetical protein